MLGIVGERHVVKFNGALWVLDDFSVGWIGLDFFCVEKIKHAASTCVGGLNLRNNCRNSVKRLHVLIGIREEALHLTDGKR